MADPLGPSILSALFLLFSAFVCALNDALPSMDASELNKKAEQDASAQRMLRLLNRYDNGFGEIRMTYAALIAASFASLAGTVCPRVCAALHVSAVLCALIALIPFCIVAFTLTGILPGALAARWPEQTLERIAAPAEWAVWLLTPVTKAAYWIGRALLKPFHLQPANASESVTEEEIRMMVDAGSEKGAIEEGEKELLQNVFEFNDIAAEDILTHRTMVDMLWTEETDAEWETTIKETNHSHYPVCGDTADDVVGVLKARDYLKLTDRTRESVMKNAVSPALFVPLSVKADDLFREMRRTRNHFAVVLDEYGGMSGIVTMNDLVEQIVGDIDDADSEEAIIPLGGGKYSAGGRAALEDIGELFGMELPTDEFDTIGGLIFSAFDVIPEDGSRFSVSVCGIHADVDKVAEHRIVHCVIYKEETQDAPIAS